MPEQDRFEKTVDKTRRGGLPAPTCKADFFPGTGKACDGCGDAINSNETLYSVEVGGIMQLRFHQECHVAWSTFSR